MVQTLGFDSAEDFLNRCVYLKCSTIVHADTSDGALVIPVLIQPWLRQPVSKKDVPGGLDFENVPQECIPPTYLDKPNCIAYGFCDYMEWPNYNYINSTTFTNIGPGYDPKPSSGRSRISQGNLNYGLSTPSDKQKYQSRVATMWILLENGYLGFEEIDMKFGGSIGTSNLYKTRPACWFELPKKI